MKKLIGWCFCICLLFASCEKDTITTNTDTDNPPNPTQTYISTVYGLVTDFNDNPIEGAEIYLGDEQQKTDEFGYFTITGEANSEQGVLRVEKGGFFTAYPVFSPDLNAKEYVQVQMVERNITQSIQTNTGGTVTTTDGAIVNFTPNAFQDADGNAYTGTVDVYMYYIDPTHEDITSFMPGNLSATNTQNETVILTSMGMLNVELEGTGGQPIQITEPATIKVPVPSSLQGLAPATIPLWHFETETGLWMEEGSATLNNGVYEGTVTHFSFWNCDVPIDYIELSGRIFVEALNPLLQVCIIRNSDGDQRCTYTDDQGNFDGKVPNGELLTIIVKGFCGEVIYEETIGPFTMDTQLDNIVVFDNQSIVTITGRVIDCQGDAVTNGYLLVKTNTTATPVILDVDADGNINGAVAVCSATEITVTPYNIEDLLKGTPTNYDVNPTVDVGDQLACGTQIVEGVTIEIPNQDPIDFIGCEVRIDIDSGGAELYMFSYTYTDTNGAVNYSDVVINWGSNGGGTDPIFAVSSSTQTFDSPDYVYNLVGNQTSDVEILINDTEIGDTFSIRIGAIDLIETDNITGQVTNYQNVTVTYTATVIPQ